MKNRILALILIFVGSTFLATISKAQSNAPATGKSIVLPPPNWREVQKHVLMPLLSTNTLGEYALPSTWVGFEQVTLRTGAFKNEWAKKDQTNRSFRFNKLILAPALGPLDRRLLCESNKNGRVSASVCGYRASLPTDAELLAMHDGSSVTNLFGFNPFAHDTNYVHSPSVHCFTIGPYNSIQTLHVAFFNHKGNSEIDSVVAMRGVFRPETTLP